MDSIMFSFWSLQTNSAFDIILAVLLPLVILFVFYQLGSNFHMTELAWGLKASATHGPFSLTRAYQSFIQYRKMSESELCAMRTSYASLGRVHKRLGYKIGYPAKLDRLQYTMDTNATIANSIADLTAKEFGLCNGISDDVSAAKGDLGRAREALRHYVRDWSTEGAKERETIFGPIISLLKTLDPKNRANMSVLVPGCGLGRLAWEISELGFDTTGNELSYFMILAFRFLISPVTTNTINEHTVHPYAHWFSHQRSNDALFRPVHFPDVIPRISEKFRMVEGDFLKLSLPSSVSPVNNAAIWKKKEIDKPSSEAVGYDFIVTLFFIDTSLNVLATMEHIYDLLKPGGAWVNLGPLLWTGGAQTKLELSLEGILAAAHEIGFIDDPSIEKRTIECEYTADNLAMMRWIYKAEFWVMRRPT